MPESTSPRGSRRPERIGEQGVTVSSVPIPEVSGVEEYLDYAQWVIEEVKPQVA